MTKAKTATRKRATKIKATKAAAKSTAKKTTPTPKPAKVRDHGLKVGATLQREYKGEKIVAQVTAAGFTWKGTEYRSLTALAKAVTGYAAISGTAFFGLWKSKADAKGGAK